MFGFFPYPCTSWNCFHCVKGSCIILVDSDFTEMKRLLQTYVYSLEILHFMLTMSQRRDILSPLGTTTYGQRQGSVCSKLPPLNGFQCLTDPRELYDLPACAFQSVLFSVLLRVEQT